LHVVWRQLVWKWFCLVKVQMKFLAGKYLNIDTILKKNDMNLSLQGCLIWIVW
jgi:hypothetical protein